MIRNIWQGITEAVIEQAAMKALGLGRLGLLGALSYDQAVEIMGWGAQGGYTDEEIRAARLVVYPAQTAEGLLVSAPRIASGEFETEAQPAAGERAIATTTAVAIPPRPVQVRPDLYTDFEDCHPTQTECVSRNYLRSQANGAILRNADLDFKRAICERNCALSTRQGHPEICRNCAAQFARIPVPWAPGTRRTVNGAALPSAPKPAAIAPAPAPGSAPAPKESRTPAAGDQEITEAEDGGFKFEFPKAITGQPWYVYAIAAAALMFAFKK